MLSWLGNILTGGLLDKVIGAWRSHEDAKFAALNNDQIRQAEERADIRRTAKEIRLATASFWEIRLLTFIIAGCFALHLLLVTLDTCFAYGWKIDKFPAPFDEWEGAILLSFFGVGGAVSVAKTIAGAGVVKAKQQTRATVASILARRREPPEAPHGLTSG